MSKNNNWIDKLSSHSFIDKKYRKYTDKSILNPLPLLPYEENLWKKLFNKPPNNDYSKLQMTKVGTYSIGQPDINKELIEFVKDQALDMKLDINKLTITETNGGLGGFSYSLLSEFNNLNIVELNPTHFKIIQNNLKVYGFQENFKKNIKIYKGDYINKMMELSQDIIISDPPWGGKDYIKQPSIRLGFSNIDITDVINYLYENKKFSLFIFLAPKNYNFNSFISNIKTKNIYIRKVRQHNFVCIKYIE
jgi:16S rRNA G966 N2-methylase RsmD